MSYGGSSQKPGHIAGARLADVGGLAAHVGAGDDLEPRLAAHQAAVVGDEVHALLRLHVRVPAACSGVRTDVSVQQR